MRDYLNFRVFQDMREQYKEKRKKELEKIKKLESDMAEDDMELFNQLKPLRVRANELIRRQ